MDNDGGGQTLAAQLIERNVDKERVFHLPRPKGDAELEDFFDSALLAEAASSLASQHHGIEKLVTAASMPKFGKWDHLISVCEKAGIKALQKVPVPFATGAAKAQRWGRWAWSLESCDLPLSALCDYFCPRLRSPLLPFVRSIRGGGF